MSVGSRGEGTDTREVSAGRQNPAAVTSHQGLATKLHRTGDCYFGARSATLRAGGCVYLAGHVWGKHGAHAAGRLTTTPSSSVDAICASLVMLQRPHPALLHWPGVAWYGMVAWWHIKSRHLLLFRAWPSRTFGATNAPSMMPGSHAWSCAEDDHALLSRYAFCMAVGPPIGFGTTQHWPHPANECRTGRLVPAYWSREGRDRLTAGVLPERLPSVLGQARFCATL